MVAVKTARTIIGILGNIIAVFMFGSPIPTFYRIAKNKSVEEFKPDPYIAAAINCLLWVFYGLPIVHPDSTLLVTVNSIGLVLELTYLLVFFTCTDNKQRVKIMIWLLAGVGVTAVIATVAILKFHTHNSRSTFVGVFCVIFLVMLYSSPLTIMKKVIHTKSVEYMPFWLSVASFCNGAAWLLYALIEFDPFIAAGNGLGALLGLAQLILYAYYYKSTPKKDHHKENYHKTPTQGMPLSSA